MQSKKRFTPHLFVNWNIVAFIPEDNFYRILKDKPDLSFFYVLTWGCCSYTGKPNLDPVVFFKLVLVGYLENICSDPALEWMVDLRIDLKYFLNYDLDERSPDHSTICKTRQRIGLEIFESVFNHILRLCVEAGLVGGKTQGFDSAYINAIARRNRSKQSFLSFSAIPAIIHTSFPRPIKWS